MVLPLEPGKCSCQILASFQPAFAVIVGFMVSSVRHDGWDEAFEVAAGSVTGFRLDGEQGRGSSASWGFRGYDDLQGVLRWLVSSRDSELCDRPDR